MRGLSGALSLAALFAGLAAPSLSLGIPAAAAAADPATPKGARHSPSDAGRTAARTNLSAEDQEVVQNLELLEHLEESQQLDLLLELSRDR